MTTDQEQPEEAKTEQASTPNQPLPPSRAHPGFCAPPSMAWIDAIMEVGGFPMRHRNTPVEGVGPWSDAYRSVLPHLGNGSIIVLCGTRGVGKTRMAVSLGRYAYTWFGTVETPMLASVEFSKRPQANKPMRVLYAKAMQMFSDIRNTYGASVNDHEKDAISRYSDASILIVDEVQERANTDWESRMFTLILDNRYDSLRDTVLISNLTPQALLENVGPSIASRIVETGIVVECEWPTFRTRGSAT